MIPADSARVVDLAERRKSSSNQEVIQKLRDLLYLAEKGEVTGFSIAYTRLNGCVSTVLELHGNLLLMGQAISALWFRYQQRMLEDSFDPKDDPAPLAE